MRAAQAQNMRNIARNSMSMPKSNSYNKSQRDAFISQLYFGKELYMYRTDLMSIISYVDCLLARSS